MPVGIPVPPWPSDLDVARPSVPSPWEAETEGFYFIAPAGCDDGREWGTPGAPRCTLPDAVQAGAVLVLDGSHSAYEQVRYQGSAAAPIWVMGANPAAPPTIGRAWEFAGSYQIVDSLAFVLDERDSIVIAGDHQMIRSTTLDNAFGDANGAGFALAGQHTIFYRNTVTRQGDWLHEGPDIDRQGLKVVGGAIDNWILNSTFYHCQSDGVAVGDVVNTPEEIQRIYVGRNVAYENLQFGFWTKNALDVIYSENIVYNQQRVTPSGPGGGLGGQYDPRFVWFLNNTIYGTNNAIAMSGSNNGGGGPWFAIGNLIYDGGLDTCSSYSSAGLSYRNDGGFTALFNTIYDTTSFVGLAPSAGDVTIENNIFAAKRGADCDAILLERDAAFANNLYSEASYPLGSEPGQVVGDPQFVAAGTDFQLGAASPAIDGASDGEPAAVTLFRTRYGLDIHRDIVGTPRPINSADLGAFERP